MTKSAHHLFYEAKWEICISKRQIIREKMFILLSKMKKTHLAKLNTQKSHFTPLHRTITKLNLLGLSLLAQTVSIFIMFQESSMLSAEAEQVVIFLAKYNIKVSYLR